MKQYCSYKVRFFLSCDEGALFNKASMSIADNKLTHKANAHPLRHRCWGVLPQLEKNKIRMKNKIGVLIFGILIFTSCKENNSSKELEKDKMEFNQGLADELKKMSEIDQIAAYIPQSKYKEL